MKFRYGQNKQADEIVERLIRNNVLACQSALIDSLMQSGFDGFEWDNVTGMSVDPSDWAIESIYDFADDNEIELDDDPRKMIREALLEQINGDEYDKDDETEEDDDELREQIADHKEGEWKDQIRDWSEENPVEPLEWWLVDSWLAGQLQEMTQEPVLDNDYGYWWGRTCSGQSIACDSTFYILAESLGYFDGIDA